MKTSGDNLEEFKYTIRLHKSCCDCWRLHKLQAPAPQPEGFRMKKSKVEPMSWRGWCLFFVSAAAYAGMFWYGLVIETGGF